MCLFLPALTSTIAGESLRAVAQTTRSSATHEFPTVSIVFLPQLQQ